MHWIWKTQQTSEYNKKETDSDTERTSDYQREEEYEGQFQFGGV